MPQIVFCQGLGNRNVNLIARKGVRMNANLNGWSMFFTAVLVLFGIGCVSAEELKVRIASYITNHEIKPVGNAEGHIAGPYLRRGLVFLESGEVGLFRSTGKIEMRKGDGSVSSESTYSFEDGSTISVSVDGDIEARPGAGLIYHRLSGKSVSGTGRYQGIKGSATATGKGLTPFGEETRSDAYFDVAVTYTRTSK